MTETAGLLNLNHCIVVSVQLKHNLRCVKLPQWSHSLHERSKFRLGEINMRSFKLDIIFLRSCHLRLLIAAETVC